MENILVIPKDKKQLSLLKSLLEEMRVKFRTEKSQDDEISLELKSKIETARKEKKAGKLITINPTNLWESI